MSPSRIVIINDRSVAAGGATALALLSARLFSEEGYNVTYITGDDGKNAVLPPSVEIIPLGGLPLLKRDLKRAVLDGVYNFAALKLLEQAIRRLDGPDVVYHLHGWSQILSPAVFRALAGVQSRLLIHAHDFFMACPNGAFFNYKTEHVCELKPLGAKCLSTNCDKRNIAQKAFRVIRSVVHANVFSVSNSSALVAMIHPAMRPFLEKTDVSNAQLRVVRNPASSFRNERVEAESNSDIFFIGRVAKEKGLEVAIQAAQIANCRLRIIGDGPERADLANKYPDIIWEGWLDHAAIAERIASARALVMPSLMPEPFGLVALEALQCGVPLVSFDHSFLAQEVAKLGCGILAHELSADSLANAFVRFDDDKLVQQLSIRAFETAHTLTYSQQEWRDQLLSIYGELLYLALQEQSTDRPTDCQ